MPDDNATTQSHPLPNPQQLLPPGGLNNKHKRWMFYGAMAIVLLIVMANIVATGPGSPGNRLTRRTDPAQQQNPTEAQIRDMQNTLHQQATELLDDAKRKAQQMEQARTAMQGALPPGATNADDFQRAAALQDAAEARAQYEQMYGLGTNQATAQSSQLQAEREQQAYKSLFADNVVRQETATNATAPEPAASPAPPGQASQPVSSPGAPQKETAPEKAKPALDFNPSAQQTYWLPEEP